jgi:hypothetical protein
MPALSHAMLSYLYLLEGLATSLSQTATDQKILGPPITKDIVQAITTAGALSRDKYAARHVHARGVQHIEKERKRESHNVNNVQSVTFYSLLDTE